MSGGVGCRREQGRAAGLILYGGRRRRQVEAVTVMAMTLIRGGPCANEIRRSERSGRFDRKHAATATRFAACSLSAPAFTVCWNALFWQSLSVKQSLLLCHLGLVGLFAAPFPAFVIAPHHGASDPT